LPSGPRRKRALLLDLFGKRVYSRSGKRGNDSFKTPSKKSALNSQGKERGKRRIYKSRKESPLWFSNVLAEKKKEGYTGGKGGGRKRPPRPSSSTEEEGGLAGSIVG